MKSFKLWNGKKIHVPSIQLPKIITHSIVHKSAAPYQFLLGADIINFNDRLLCSWGASRKSENDRYSVMNAASSADGINWDDYFRISPPNCKGRGYSHGVLFNENGRLCAYIPCAKFNIGTYDDLHTIKIVYDNSQWVSEGIVIPEHFWPMTAPQQTSSGTLLMPGIIINERGAMPAIARRISISPEKWQISIINVPGSKRVWGEGGLLISDNKILYIFRNSWGAKNVACVSLSNDDGRTWSDCTPTNFLMSQAKPCCGTLPDRRNYIVCNMPCENYRDRDTMVLALSPANSWLFDKLWIIRHGASPQNRAAGRDKGSQWAYPQACVKNGILHIVYSSAKEDCIMSSIPITALD